MTLARPMFPPRAETPFIPQPANSILIGRRRLLGAFAALAPATALAAATPSVAALAASSADLNPDAEIIKLSDEILELSDRAQVIYNERCAPFHKWRDEISARGKYLAKEERQMILESIELREKETGADIANDEHDALVDACDRLIKKLWLIPAKTIEGKQAKVRALFHHVLHPDWFASDREANWDIEMTRKLLFELASMDGGDLIEIDAEVNEPRSNADLDVDAVLWTCSGRGIPANVRVDVAIAAHRVAYAEFLARHRDADEQLALDVLRVIILARTPAAQDRRDQLNYLSALPSSAWEGETGAEEEAMRRDTLAMIERGLRQVELIEAEA